MPIITISRQGGAGGKTLAEMVSRKMGYTCVDDDIIRMVAKQAKVSPEWVQSVEKEAGGALFKFIDGLISKSYIERILGYDKGYINEDVYIDTLNKVINRLAEEGNCVILGRGGQYILRDRKDTYHVLLIANKEDRIKFMLGHYDLTPDQAKTLIERHDKRRANLFRKFGKEDYDRPDLYHIVLNTSKVEMEKASQIVCDLVSR